MADEQPVSAAETTTTMPTGGAAETDTVVTGTTDGSTVEGSGLMEILLVEDEEAHAELLRRAFTARGEEVRLTTVGSLREARTAIAGRPPDLAIVDLQLPDGRGTDLITGLQEASFPVVLMTSHGNEQVAVEAMKAGALDYVVKSPAALAEMPRVALRSLREWRHIIERQRAEQEKSVLLERVRQQNATVVRLATHQDLAGGNLDTGLGDVAGAAARTLQVDLVSIYDLSDDGARLCCIREYRRSDGPQPGGDVLLVENHPRFFLALGGGRVLDAEDVMADSRTCELATVRWQPHRIGATLVAPIRLGGEMVGIVFHDHAGSTRTWHPDEVAFAGQVADLVARAFLAADLQQSHRDLRQAYDTTLEGWARALELRDRETEGHCERVTGLTLSLAEAIGMDAEQLVHVRRGALLHDIGKMGIPDSVLLKPGRLTEKERREMERHPVIAYEFLSPIDFLAPALDIPYCHHEKWDGSGYPRGLQRDQIPLAARIFAVVDVWDALRSDRPYRKAWPIEKVISYIHEESGSHFDPDVVEVFFRTVVKAGR